MNTGDHRHLFRLSSYAILARIGVGLFRSGRWRVRTRGDLFLHPIQYLVDERVIEFLIHLEEVVHAFDDIVPRCSAVNTMTVSDISVCFSLSHFSVIFSAYLVPLVRSNSGRFPESNSGSDHKGLSFPLTL